MATLKLSVEEAYSGTLGLETLLSGGWRGAGLCEGWLMGFAMARNCPE